MNEQFFEYLLRLADDRLILGHRLSEWCGHGPTLEEDIALTNIALDLIGQANLLLRRAAEVEGEGRDADALAFLREPSEYRNALIVELPRGDFAFTILRQLIFSSYSVRLWEELTSSTDAELAGIAAKALKESRYHLRHAGEWVMRLGDGTEESHGRMHAAIDQLQFYDAELCLPARPPDPVEDPLVAQGVAVSSPAISTAWTREVREIVARATLTWPDDEIMPRMGGRSGHHTEHLTALLAEMQVLPRTHPGANW